MEGNTLVSAGTFVAAVLEHMGYMAQADFLQKFISFFRDAGAILYLLAGAGAIMSVAMYGSFRAARYLMVGPAIFWFLVGPTTEVEGVVWKIGGGTPRGFFGKTGEGVAKSDRDRTIEKAGVPAQSSIKVSTGFWLFAHLANEFVNEFTNVLLDQEDADDLLASSRVRGLEMIANSMPSDSDLVNRMRSFADQCWPVYGSAEAAAFVTIKKQTANDHGTTKDFQAPEMEKLRQKHIANMNKFAESAQMKRVYHTGFDKLIKDKDKNAKIPQTLFCTDAWKMLGEDLFMLAGKDVPKMLVLSSGPWETADGQAKACKELMRKLYGEDSSGGCELRPGIALAMIHNAMQHSASFRKVLERHWGDRDSLNLSNRSVLVALGMGRLMEAVRDATGALITMSRFIGSGVVDLALMNVKTPQGAVSHSQNVPVSQVSMIFDNDMAMWFSTRQYDTVRLRQQFFTWAMQLPYYQGILLFLIAAAYPFLTLIVILPGRAGNFLLVPLAWLCVKSWDIGFAAAIILEKAMYNILPAWVVPQELRTVDGWTKLENLPLILSQAYNFDPMGSIHFHYMAMSMVTMAIPPISFAVFLKGRGNILAVFTRGANAHAMSSGHAASQKYQETAIASRNAMVKQLSGFSRLAGLAEGLDKGSARLAATIQGGMAGVAAAASAAAGKGFEDVFKGDAWDVAKGYPDYVKAFAETIQDRQEYQTSLRYAFDPLVGAHGLFTMAADAWTAAMFGGGSFEMYEYDKNAWEPMAKAFAGLVDRSVESTAKLAGAATGSSPDIIKSLGKGSGTPMIALLAGMSLAMKHTGGFEPSLASLKRAVKGERWGDDEFLAATFFADRNVFSDPEIRAALTRTKASFTAPERELFQKFFGAVDGAPLPGGPSSLELQLSAVSGERYAPCYPNATPGNWTDAWFKSFKTPKGMEDTWRSRQELDRYRHDNTPDIYEDAVKDRTTRLNQIFHFQNMSLEGLAHYAFQVQKKEKQNQPELPGDLPMDIAITAKSMPLLAATLLDQWEAKRSGRTTIHEIVKPDHYEHDENIIDSRRKLARAK